MPDDRRLGRVHRRAPSPWVHTASVVAITLALGCARGSTPAAGPPHSEHRHDFFVTAPLRYQGVPLHAIHWNFMGNDELSLEPISGKLVPATIDVEEGSVEYALLWVSAWYYDHGYVAANVGQPLLHVDGDTLVVDVAIEEGGTYRIRSLECYEDQGEVRAVPFGWKAPLGKGALFERQKLLDAIHYVETIYRDLGYAWVTANPEAKVFPEVHEVSLAIPVFRGPRTHFGKFHFVGNETTSDELLRREIAAKEGALYGETVLMDAKNHLLATGWFTRVDVSTKKGAADDLVDVTFEFDERPANAPAVTAMR